MITASRGFRFVWLMGFVLLLCSALGAGWILNQPATGTTPVSPNEPPVIGVVGLGYVDVEDGISFLHPAVPGAVERVYVREGDEVSKGDLLLSLDSTVNRLKLREAQADLDAAREEYAEAKRKLKNEPEHELAILGKKVELARLDLESAKKERDLYRKLFDGKQVAEEQMAVYENKVKSAEKAIEVLTAVEAKVKDVDSAGPLQRLKAKIESKQAQVAMAQRAVVESDLYAPADGMVLRVFATPGELLTSQSRQPAVQFCPKVPRIVRAEILQEWANKIQPGQAAQIEDETRTGVFWKGKVERVGDWFAHRRSIILEPFQYNDVRTLECIVSFEGNPPPVRIGQRVRVTIKQ